MTIITRDAITAMTDQYDLMDLVGLLAARWRYAGMHALVEEQGVIQAVYAAAIARLFAIGYDEVGGLDVESELPDAFMPHEYLARYPGF